MPPDPVPDAAFFAANPGAIVNVHSGFARFANCAIGVCDSFDFNGATINVFEDAIVSIRVGVYGNINVFGGTLSSVSLVGCNLLSVDGAILGGFGMSDDPQDPLGVEARLVRTTGQLVTFGNMGSVSIFGGDYDILVLDATVGTDERSPARIEGASIDSFRAIEYEVDIDDATLGAYAQMDTNTHATIATSDFDVPLIVDCGRSPGTTELTFEVVRAQHQTLEDLILGREGTVYEGSVGEVFEVPQREGFLTIEFANGDERMLEVGTSIFSADVSVCGTAAFLFVEIVEPRPANRFSRRAP
ncbi:MAG: hypothetical protein AAFX79_06730 [Planctomycetota bacterium]